MHDLNTPLEASGLLLRTKARMQSGAGSAVGNDRIARQMRTNHIRGGLLPRKKGAKSAAAASAGVERRRPFAWRMQMPLPLRGRLVIKRAMHPKGGLRRGREAGLPLYVRYDALHGQGQNEKNHSWPSCSFFLLHNSTGEKQCAPRRCPRESRRNTEEEGATIRNKETKRRCGMPRRRKHDTREEDANRGRPPHPAVGLSRRQCKGGPGKRGCAQCGNQGKRQGQKKSAHEEKARCAGLRRLRAADLRTSPAEFMAVFLALFFLRIPRVQHALLQCATDTNWRPVRASKSSGTEFHNSGPRQVLTM